MYEPVPALRMVFMMAVEVNLHGELLVFAVKEQTCSDLLPGGERPGKRSCTGPLLDWLS